MGTELVGGSQRQGGMYAIFPGFIIGRGDNSSLCWITCPANDDRFPDESRIPFLFDSGEKGVHVDVEDASSLYIGIVHVLSRMAYVSRQKT